jgi:hypothetical protein
MNIEMLDEKSVQDIYDRTVKAFTPELWNDLVPAERRQVYNMVGKIADEEGPQAVTNDRMEGVKEILMFEWTGDFNPWSIGLPVSQDEDSSEEASS